jgi:hypothetical protein
LGASRIPYSSQVRRKLHFPMKSRFKDTREPLNKSSLNALLLNLDDHEGAPGDRIWKRLLRLARYARERGGETREAGVGAAEGCPQGQDTVGASTAPTGSYLPLEDTAPPCAVAQFASLPSYTIPKSLRRASGNLFRSALAQPA